jgi:hypothetical protein
VARAATIVYLLVLALKLVHSDGAIILTIEVTAVQTESIVRQS